MTTSDVFGKIPGRIEKLSMPGWQPKLGQSLRAAERELERAKYDGKLLDLTCADTHRFPPPPWALEMFQRAASGEGMTYTPYAGDVSVRQAVADNLGKTLGLTAKVENVILTPGTQAGLYTALSSIVEQGDHVILADPEYLSTERMLHYLGATVTHVPLIRDSTGLAMLDVETLEAAMRRRPALLVFSNPNNPTGAVHSKHSIETIARLAKTYNVPVLVDQLYCRLVYGDTKFHHLAAIEGMAERTVTLLGPSKTESLSGYRLGVALAPSGLIERMEDVLSVSALRAPAYAQHVLKRWLADDQDYVAKRIGEYENLRNMAIERFAKTNLLEVIPARGTAYLFVHSTAGLPDQKLALALKTQAGLVVNPGYQFGPRGEGHFRICFAQDEKAWEGALERIVETVTRLARINVTA
ncbi:pyridoxal phosphate-dependent aminotransferase [Rhodoligotrophos defluvii]|uniref:pyridoxal phosphate-dependent aminotransferase n=1 Tax=Rhodoligotrophos defluvii TaxID=2561934 RepID=UPI00196173DD|nr:aminotransferase class I/II-fold pyridoxal phosphate-dependent enzyme [Rhodoligotrophos defluvii]